MKETCNLPWHFTGNYAPLICMPCPDGAGDTADLLGLKCRNLTNDVSLQCRRCAGVLISRWNRPLLKELVWKVLLSAHLTIDLYIYANVNRKGCNLAVLVINSHVLRQGWTQKLSYRGWDKISKEGGIQVFRRCRCRYRCGAWRSYV